MRHERLEYVSHLIAVIEPRVRKALKSNDLDPDFKPMPPQPGNGNTIPIGPHNIDQLPEGLSPETRARIEESHQPK